MVEGKKIKGACSIVDVAKVLGSNSTDAGTLCRSSLINKWARYKPEQLARRMSIPQSLTNAERKSNNFSLKIPTVHTNIVDASNDGLAWFYNQPITNEFANLDDFTNVELIDEGNTNAIGYNGEAVSPIISIMGVDESGTLTLDLGRATTTNKVYGYTGVITSEITPTSTVTDKTDIPLGDLQKDIDGTPLTDWYVAFAIGQKDSSGNIAIEGWKTANTPIVSDDDRVGGAIAIELSTDDWDIPVSASDNYVYMFVASKNAKTTFSQSSGSFIALPFASHYFASGKLIIEKNIVPAGCVITIPSNARTGAEPIFTIGNSGLISYYSGYGTMDGAVLDCATMFMPNYFDFTITNNGTTTATFLRNQFQISASKTLVSDESTGILQVKLYQVTGTNTETVTEITSDTSEFNVAAGETMKLRIGIDAFMQKKNGGTIDIPTSVGQKITNISIRYKGSSIAECLLAIKYNS